MNPYTKGGRVAMPTALSGMAAWPPHRPIDLPIGFPDFRTALNTAGVIGQRGLVLGIRGHAGQRSHPVPARLGDTPIRL